MVFLTAKFHLNAYLFYLELPSQGLLLRKVGGGGGRQTREVKICNFLSLSKRNLAQVKGCGKNLGVARQMGLVGGRTNTKDTGGQIQKTNGIGGWENKY